MKGEQGESKWGGTLRHINVILIKQQNNLPFLMDVQAIVDFTPAFKSMKVNSGLSPLPFSRSFLFIQMNLQ